MNYKFDDYGWFCGTSDTPTARSTPVPPGDLTIHAEAGTPRSNFTGHKWVMLPFSLPVPPPPVLPTVEDFTDALTNHLDAVAQQRQYDNRVTCAVRAGYVGPFQAEGQAFAVWMDTCNAMAYTLLAEVQAGTRPMPTTTQALIDVLPAMVWPT